MSTNYRASQNLSITLTSLASSSSLTVGRCSAAYSNATNKDDFAIPALKVRSGASPTAGQIELWAFMPRADGTWPEIFTSAYTGADGAFTVNSRDILFGGAVLVGVVTTDGNSDRDYILRGRELSQLFGAVPSQVAFFVTHSTAQPLSATTSHHALTINPGNYT